jgi:hypothetical protein
MLSPGWRRWILPETERDVGGSQHGLGKYKLRDIRTVTMIEQVFGRLDVKLL